MSDLLDNLDLWLWRSVVQATIWLVVGDFVSRYYAGRPARVHRVLLLAAGAALLAPVLSAASQAAGWGVLVGPPPARMFTVVGQVPPPPPGVWDRLAEPAVLIRFGLVAGWLAVSGWLAVRLVRSLRAGARVFGHGRNVDDPAVCSALERAARGLGLARLPGLVRCRVESPLVWCWGGRPRVVLPDGPLPAGPGLEAVLRHELAHVRRRDGWAGLVTEVLVVVFWWHPLAWLARRRLALTAEFACDDWVVAGEADVFEYVAALLALVPSPRPCAALPAATASLPKRVRRLLRRTRVEVPEVGRAWAAAALALTVVLAVGVASLHARPGPKPDGRGAAGKSSVRPAR